MIQRVYIGRVCYAITQRPEGLRVFRCRIAKIRYRGSALRCLVEELTEDGSTFDFYIRYDFELYRSLTAAEACLKVISARFIGGLTDE